MIVGCIELRCAESAIVRKYGVSRTYVRLIMAANRSYLLGELSISHWMWTIRAIQSRFPADFARVGDIGVTWLV